jgi:hypothetical protein
MALARSTSGSPLAKNRFENREGGGDEEGNVDRYIGRRVVSCSSDLRIEDGSGESVLLIVLSILSVHESVVIESIELAIATPNLNESAAGMKTGEGEVLEFENEVKVQSSCLPVRRLKDSISKMMENDVDYAVINGCSQCDGEQGGGSTLEVRPSMSCLLASCF